MAKNMLPIRVFVGFDSRETSAFHVVSHSLQIRASRPVSITPIMLSQLDSVMWRKRDPLQSTDFSFSRFLVPSLCAFDGWAIFMDCDMLVLDDIAHLWDLRDDGYAVMCVHHSHQPREDTKFLGEKQTRYEKKNWSSLMLMNCSKCSALTPDYVNSATGLQLHRFEWLEDDQLIGRIPKRWNHLVDYDPLLPLSDVSILHYTNGGPYWSDFRDCGYADLWFKERDRMLFAMQRAANSERRVTTT